MRALRTALLLACAGLMLGSTLSFAESKQEDESIFPAAGPNCDVTGYKTERLVYTAPIPIPDNNAAGVTLGPLVMPADGDIINDVILELNAAHTWVGDLIVTLTYDEDCDGPGAPISARVLCRPRGTSAGAPAPCGASTGFGCSGNLVATGGAYLFSDEGTASLGVGANCVSNLPFGCYKQSDIGGSPFSIWRGLNKGGCWRLHLSDNAGADTGGVSGWAIHIRNQRPVPVSAASWGSVKGIYR